VLLWVGSSFVLRVTLNASIGGTSIYGPLAAPIVVLIWLYFLAIAVLIGAAVNAASRTLWPVVERSREQRGARWRGGDADRTRRPGHERPLTPMPPAVFASEPAEGPSAGATAEKVPDLSSDEPAAALEQGPQDVGPLDSLRRDRLLSGRTHSG